MKNLKDYLKLIFTAVMGFIMSLLPDKKNAGKVPGEAVLKEKRTTGRNVCGLTDALVDVEETGHVIKSSEPFRKRRNTKGRKTHRHRLYTKQKISNFAYYNTG